MSWVIGPAASACLAEWLTRVAAVQYVDSWGVRPDVPHVSVDGDAGPVPFEHPSGVLVGLAHPSRLSAKGSMDGNVEAAGWAPENRLPARRVFSGIQITPHFPPSAVVV